MYKRRLLSEPEPIYAIKSVPERDYLTTAGGPNVHFGSERIGLEKLYESMRIGVTDEE